MKLNYLVLWIVIIFSMSGSFAQLIDVSQTPTQGAFRTGGFQTTPITTSPSQQAYEIGSTPLSLGPETSSKQANAAGGTQTIPEIQTNGLPSVTITSPTEGSTIPAGNVTVTVDVKNFKLVNKPGQLDIGGQGHLHYYIDVPVPASLGRLATASVGGFVPTSNTSLTWTNVATGPHNFSVQLANNDYSALTPLVYATVNVTLTAPTLKTMSIKNVTVDLIAKNIAFNTSKIVVPAGANVTVNFDNQDTSIPHSFAVYTNDSAKTAIFQGKIITGPAKVVYTFNAPSEPGTYFFRCDVHPTQMNGQFIAQ